MRLLHAQLRHVRLHRELAVTFHPRLTLLGGANETGKSTLVEALHKGLFLKASATGKGVEELRSRAGGQPEVEIGFEAGERQWLLRKRFSGSSGTVQLSDGAGIQLSGAAAEERLAALLGVEGAVEGRQISQLPQRWAHLWVRQGEAGGNPLEGKGNSYDLDRLVHQLQQRGSNAALESPLDRQVEALLQGELDQLFTATGKVKAGSPLAKARQQQEQAAEALDEARQRREQLEAALEELERIASRLQEIDGMERPALEAQLQAQGQAQRALEQTEAKATLERSRREPLAQQLQSLQALQQQWGELSAEQAKAHAERDSCRSAQAEQQHQQQTLAKDLEQRQQALAELQQELADRAQALELGQLLLDQAEAAQRSAELGDQRKRFSALQEQAAAVKTQLAELPAITAEQLQALRQAERRVALAQARAEAMAAGLEVLSADQPLVLDGKPLQPGASVQLSTAASLKVGEGVRLVIRPGGGEALEQAAGERQAAQQALNALLKELAVADGEQAEQLLRQRTALEGDLNQLRKNASEIPWQKLDSQIAAQAQRSQQIGAQLQQQAPALGRLQSRGVLPEHEGLAGWLSEARQLQQAGQTRWQQLQQEQQSLQARQQQVQQQLQRTSTQLGELEGRLTALAQRQASLTAEHGSSEALAQQIRALQHHLTCHDGQLAAIEQELSQLRQQLVGTGEDQLNQRLQQLLAEKDSLLSARGQHEQLCRSLGASDPQAALEQAEAAWETAREQCAAIEARASALQLLLERFRNARSALADRYSQPMALAIGNYLASLEVGTDAALLQFDAAKGFAELQLRQSSESFGFDKLSGGTREQVAAAVRLALAEVLAPAYDGALPLVFDDAFTNSDPERIKGLKRMLERASEQGVQVLLLSCTPNDYADLAGRIGSQVNLAG
jgi:DNA repair exonuclease SbcCD ATPase subunit